RGARAAGQARREPELGDARRLFAVLVAGQRPPAEERNPACGRVERAGRHDRAVASVAGHWDDATPALGVWWNAPWAELAEPRVGGRAGRAGLDSGGTRPGRRQYFRDGAFAGAHTARSVPENSAPRPRFSGRSRHALAHEAGYLVISYWLSCILTNHFARRFEKLHESLNY